VNLAEDEGTEEEQDNWFSKGLILHSKPLTALQYCAVRTQSCGWRLLLSKQSIFETTFSQSLQFYVQLEALNNMYFESDTCGGSCVNMAAGCEAMI
jgi:hypothetical protein